MSDVLGSPVSWMILSRANLRFNYTIRVIPVLGLPVRRYLHGRLPSSEDTSTHKSLSDCVDFELRKVYRKGGGVLYGK